jgi:CubicO group peptidase (beta-lactamase class C family)
MMLSGGKGVLKPGSVAAMTQPQSPPGSSALRGLGWDIDSPYAVWLAPSFSTQSYGHTGYTGTAIWIDPSTRTFLIVLTNRLHPDGKGNNLQMLRRISTVAGAVPGPRIDVYVGGAPAGEGVDWSRLTVPGNVKVTDERASSNGYAADAGSGS